VYPKEFVHFSDALVYFEDRGTYLFVLAYSVEGGQ
jgi:hypothetical protein